MHPKAQYIKELGTIYLEAELFNKVKASFILQGTSFNAWCLVNTVSPANAKSALLGGWTGPKARELRTRILKVTGLLSDTPESTSCVESD